MPLIEVRDLRKAFRVRKQITGPVPGLRRMFSRASELCQAVDGVTFDVSAGEIVGYLGANGAGKSTTVKCLAGILTPDAGRVTVAGLDPARERMELARRIGVVFGQKTALWWDLPVNTTFNLLRAIYDVPEARFRDSLGTLVDLLGLAPLLHIPVRQLSLGQRVKCDLAAAFLHEPDVLFLDEPTIGLDAVAKSNIRRFIKDIRTASGVSVLLTTHDLGDIEQLCDRLIIIDHGQVLFQGTVQATINTFAPYVRLLVELSDEFTGPIRVPGARAVVVEDDRHAMIEVSRDVGDTAAITSYVLAHYPVRDLRLQDPSIEDVVRVLYERSAPVETGSSGPVEAVLPAPAESEPSHV